MQSQLKYLSMNGLIFGPKSQNIPATRKKRAERLTTPARTKMGKLILKAPEVMVMTLNGMGVKPAVKTIQNEY